MFKKIRRILFRSIVSKDINFKTAKQMIKNDPNIILLDVRSKQEYQEGHLTGSINISLYDLKRQAELKIPNKHSNIIVYCSSGIRSKQAQEILEEMGYENVYNIKGGLNYIEQ